MKFGALNKFEKFLKTKNYICYLLIYIHIASKTLINILHKSFAEKYNKLRKIINKLHKTSSIIAFIRKALYYNVISTFAQVKSHIQGNITIKNTAEKKLRKHIWINITTV